MTRTSLRLLRARARQFRDEIGGNVTMEAMLALPILFWAYMAMFVFFDAYRAKNTNIKAAYTISDLLSRETVPLDQTYLDGLDDMFAYLTTAKTRGWLRITVIGYNDKTGGYTLDWSRATGKENPVYTVGDLDQLAKKLPLISAGETLIVVETFARYTPSFSVGLVTLSLDNFVVTTPRFAPTLLFGAPLRQ
jgi:Flp pilus assembly protein TadG